jgi:hypothetical protein
MGTTCLGLFRREPMQVGHDQQSEWQDGDQLDGIGGNRYSRIADIY